MNPYAFSTAGVTDQYKINELEENAVDRDAIRERMVFCEMTKQHKGKSPSDFPFDAVDLARFIIGVIKNTLPAFEEPVIEAKEEPLALPI